MSLCVWAMSASFSCAQALCRERTFTIIVCIPYSMCFCFVCFVHSSGILLVARISHFSHFHVPCTGTHTRLLPNAWRSVLSFVFSFFYFCCFLPLCTAMAECWIQAANTRTHTHTTESAAEYSLLSVHFVQSRTANTKSSPYYLNF